MRSSARASRSCGSRSAAGMASWWTSMISVSASGHDMCLKMVCCRFLANVADAVRTARCVLRRLSGSPAAWASRASALCRCSSLSKLATRFGCAKQNPTRPCALRHQLGRGGDVVMCSAVRLEFYRPRAEGIREAGIHRPCQKISPLRLRCGGEFLSGGASSIVSWDTRNGPK